MDGQNHRPLDLSNFAAMNTHSRPATFTRPFPSNAEIGRRMRIARKKRGWTIAQMAQAGKINAVVIGSYERGSRNMPISRLGEIAEILGVDVGFLLNQPPSQLSPVQILTFDLRAISQPTQMYPERLALVVNYCAAIVKTRNDWNGEVLTIRDSDLTNLSYSIGIEQTELLNWLNSEKLLLTGINHS